MSNKKELSEKKGAPDKQGVAAGAPPAVSQAGAEEGGGVARTPEGSGPSAGAAAATEGGANPGLHIVSGRPSTGKTALITAAAGAAVKKEPALYDEWLIAKKIGMRPRFVVRWRRERGKEGVDYERVRGCDAAGQAYERIGLTIHGARRAAEAENYRPCSPKGCELVRRGIQVEVKRMPSNPRILICERVAARETGALDNVFVRDSACFRIGDEMVAERDEGVLKKNGGVFAQGEW